MLKRAQKRAKRKGLVFDISLSDIDIPAVCPVLGISLAVTNGGTPSDTSPSLDRLDSRKGYVKGNVQVISWRANRIKCDATVDEVKRLLSYMTRVR